MKAIIFGIGTLVVFGVTNGMIAHKETIIRNGITMYVELAPRDPRSLMQGDYMALRYVGPQNVRPTDRRGKFVVRVDANKVAEFARVYAGEALADGEHLLRYTRGRRGTRIGTDSFFFQEGHGSHYANARYGELKVARTGESIMVGLRNADRSLAGPP
jgi:uncharacterized membrane-anchored protein